jgi:hypothetical protein
LKRLVAAILRFATAVPSGMAEDLMLPILPAKRTLLIFIRDLLGVIEIFD